MEKFPWQSPYVAFDNNPIYFHDPKGGASQPYFWNFLLSAIEGAFIGGTSEFVFQVADALLFGEHELSDAINEVKWAEVAAEMGMGALQNVLPIANYISKKVAEMFTGKYRKMTMYLVKISMESIEELLNEVLKERLKGNKIDLLNTLTAVLGKQLMGEILSAKPIIDRSLKRSSKEISDNIARAKALNSRISTSKEKLEEAVEPSARRKLEKHIDNLTKQRNKKQDKASKLLAKEYTKFVGGENSEKLLERAKGKVHDKIYEVTIGPLTKENIEE